MKPLIFRYYETIAYHADGVLLPENLTLAPNSDPDPISGLRTYYALGVAHINIDNVVAWEANALLTQQIGVPVSTLVTARRSYNVPYTVEQITANFGTPVTFE